MSRTVHACFQTSASQDLQQPRCQRCQSAVAALHCELMRTQLNLFLVQQVLEGQLAHPTKRSSMIDASRTGISLQQNTNFHTTSGPLE